MGFHLHCLEISTPVSCVYRRRCFISVCFTEVGALIDRDKRKLSSAIQQFFLPLRKPSIALTDLTRYASRKLDFYHRARARDKTFEIRLSGNVRRTGNNIKKRNFDASADGIYDSPFVAGDVRASLCIFAESDFLPGPLEAKLIGKDFRARGRRRSEGLFFPSPVPFLALLFYSCSSEMIIRRFLLSRRFHGRARAPLPSHHSLPLPS